MIGREVFRWQMLAACPPREIFSVMEQMIGTYPFRFEVKGDRSARIIESERKGLVGNWTKRMLRPLQWVSCEVESADVGTIVTITCSRRSRIGGRDPAPSRALQLIRLITEGGDDKLTVYRSRAFPPGPVTLIASWAGTPYRLFLEPRWDATRGPEVFTASRLEAVGDSGGPFVRVRLAGATEGYIERDQLVVTPGVATRAAQIEAARFV